MGNLVKVCINETENENMLKTELTMFLTGVRTCSANRSHSLTVISKRKFILQHEKSKAKRWIS